MLHRVDDILFGVVTLGRLILRGEWFEPYIDRGG